MHHIEKEQDIIIIPAQGILDGEQRRELGERMAEFKNEWRAARRARA